MSTDDKRAMKAEALRVAREQAMVCLPVLAKVFDAWLATKAAAHNPAPDGA